ncbi:hypothetical protein IT418_01965 [bacterium]|nr:hypothetical protein [bacterium]
MKQRKKIFNALGILAIGAILTVGGLFLWPNQFNIIFAPQASSKKVQAIVEIGEKTSEKTTYAQTVKREIDKSITLPIEVVSFSETTRTTSLRDQAVLGYNSLTKPIKDHIYFFVTLGQSELVAALQHNESKQTVTNKVTSNLTELVELLASRPGVFPSGFTVFLATFPKPIKGDSDIARCGQSFTNATTAKYLEAYDALKQAEENVRTLYPQYVKIVTTSSFSAHTLENSNRWFVDCLHINPAGENGLAKAFIDSAKN